MLVYFILFCYVYGDDPGKRNLPVSYETISIEIKDSVIWCKLNRPEVRNAFNRKMIEELIAVTGTMQQEIRAMVLYGEGPVFCAGGDLKWMQQSLELNKQENLEDTMALANMYFRLDRLPVPLIGLVHGAAMGGGVGLVCVCDYAIATEDTQFSFSEPRLGIVPACISPFVIRKIGPGHARALFTTTERFQAKKAYEIGLVHQIVSNREEGFALLPSKLEDIAQCGPNALRLAKNLVFNLLFADDEAQLRRLAELLASVRVSEEGQEGLRAFLEKRKPKWVE